MPVPFRLLVVPGVTVDRWARAWAQRRPEVALHLVATESGPAAPAALVAGQADAGLLRPPVDPDTFHAIPLYTEATVVVVPRDHRLAAADELTVADLDQVPVLRPLDDVLDWTGTAAGVTTDRPVGTAAAVELVAAGAGVLVVPQSLARSHQRRDLTYRVVTDAPTSSVALVWLRDRHTDLVEEMVGIVRGRTANSTRGRPAPAPAPAPVARTGRTGTRRGGTGPRPSGRRGR